jgi:hypothetical protein
VPERHRERRKPEDRPQDADPDQTGVPSDPSEVLEGEVEADHGHAEDDDNGDHDADEDVVTHADCSTAAALEGASAFETRWTSSACRRA